MVEALDRANAPDATLNTLQRVYGILNRGCAVAPVEVSDLLLLKVEHLGQTLSRRLGVPFISGKTGNVLDTLNQHDTVVMSKVGDAGLSINATRVIEADFLGGRTEIGQRALRTQHAGQQGEFHMILTKKEYNTHSRRLSALFALLSLP
jgi:hypothetical protein